MKDFEDYRTELLNLTPTLAFITSLVLAQDGVFEHIFITPQDDTDLSIDKRKKAYFKIVQSDGINYNICFTSNYIFDLYVNAYKSLSLDNKCSLQLDLNTTIGMELDENIKGDTYKILHNVVIM